MLAKYRKTRNVRRQSRKSRRASKRSQRKSRGGSRCFCRKGYAQRGGSLKLGELTDNAIVYKTIAGDDGDAPRMMEYAEYKKQVEGDERA